MPRRKLTDDRRLTQKQVLLNLPLEMAENLKHYADEEGAKLTPFIRRICYLYLKQRAAAERKQAA